MNSIDLLFCEPEEAIKIATGQANAESPHLTVPFYMPLALPICSEQTLTMVSPELSEWIQLGLFKPVAVAHGTMAYPGDEPRPIQFVLLFGSSNLGDEPGYYTFETVEREFDTAVMMRGDGTRFLDEKELPAEEATALWMGGFLGWNEKVPGLYRLRYALVN